MIKSIFIPCVVMLSVLAASVAKADQVQYIADPDQALAARTEMIKSAKKTIDLAYFIYEPCEASTQLLMEELAAKARSGVRVRMIMDAFLYKADLKNNLTAEFAKHGMELRFYNDTFVLNPGNNMRSHIKFLLVDGKIYLTGGRNMADDYYAMLDGINFVDRDALVSGNSGREAQASFEELWNSRLVSSRLKKARTFIPWTQFCKKDESKSVARARSFMAERSASILATAPQRTCQNVHFLTDSPLFGYVMDDRNRDDGPANRDFMTFERLQKKRVTKAYINFFSGVKSKLEIENWSYMPTGSIDSALRGLRKQNIPIFGITNSAADEPGLLGKEEVYLTAHYAERDTEGSSIVIQMALGGRLNAGYALTPAKATFRLHGKVAVRDDRDSIVSSFNIDPRSYHTNLESAVVVQNCPEFARDIQDQFRILRRDYAQDIREGHAARPEDASLLTKIVGVFGLNFM